MQNVGNEGIALSFAERFHEQDGSHDANHAALW